MLIIIERIMRIKKSAKDHLNLKEDFFYFVIILACILSYHHRVQARTIWRIGDPNNNTYEEFGIPDFDEYIINYQVPENWNLIENWSAFPRYLCTPDLEIPPEEIHITYNYQERYNSPVLRIMAKSGGGNFTQRLVILKGGSEIIDVDASPITSFYLFEFPVGTIEKGVNKEDEITIKNESISGDNLIYFDYLELDDRDEDGDGAIDDEELLGDPNIDTDRDGIKDYKDPDTACIIIQTHDRSITKKIILDIQEQENNEAYFKGLILIDPNTSVTLQPENSFFPYGLFRTDIMFANTIGDFSLKMIFPERIYPMGKFYLYNNIDEWKDIPIEIIDGNCIISLIKGEDFYDYGEGITITGGFAYIQKTDISLDKDQCFISSLSISLISLRLLLIIILSCLSVCLFLFFKFFKPGCLKGKYCNKIKRITILMFLILFFIHLKTRISFALKYPDMKMNATPNPVGSGARALGIGGAFMAVADDATSASWNPGGLPKLKRPEVSCVFSSFSGKNNYSIPFSETGNEEIIDLLDSQRKINYLSFATPFRLFNRNFVFSLNYQHLYEFSQDNVYKFKYGETDPVLGTLIDISMTSHKKQNGSLNTFSPALAINIDDKLFLGLTTNFWLKDELNNHWENINVLRGEGMVFGERIKTYTELYERYEFSGFNFNIGFLWQPNLWLTLGGVLKTPFKAAIKHKYQKISMEEYPENIALNTIQPPRLAIEDLKLKMPASFGLGVSIDFSDRFLIALDIYHTQWQDYLICDPNGDRISPINKKPKEDANIKPTTQIRLGFEYLIIYPLPVVPIRAGIFYDPEPASGNVDDFYGFSSGTGITFKRWSFDIAYQYRFGSKREAEDMLNKVISSKVRQHYFYSSIIFYF